MATKIYSWPFEAFKIMDPMTSILQVEKGMVLLKNAMATEEHSSYIDRLGNDGMSSCA